ncbi:MAG: hypothetical protein DRP81_08000 [Candidatus Omnitrophota bacterium]|nr:MAG: hypothetical protein DRP81_08000 [Candidatus Omnitrophota bacterium]
MSKRWMLLAFMVISLVFMGVTTWAVPPNLNAPVQARVEISNTDSGQVVIFPYYDVERDVECLIYNIVNTTPYWLQGHLRFREGKKSIEVLDFDIILSPHDVFLFMALGEGYFGKPGFYSADSNTLAYSSERLRGVKEFTSGAVFCVVDPATGACVSEDPNRLADPNEPKVAGIPFKLDRLKAVGFSEDDAKELIKRGYVEFVVEGMIEDDWMDYDDDDKPDYPTLLQAAIRDSRDINLWGVADWRPLTGPQNVAHCFYPGFPIPGLTIGGNQAYAPVNPVFGIVHYYDVTAFTGYGQNAFQLVNWRTPPDPELYPCHWIDLGYQPADAVNVISGITNGLILHEDNLFNISAQTNLANPFYRPDWTTTTGTTIAFGDDLDINAAAGNIEDVWGSVDEIETALYNAMDPWIGGLFFSAEIGGLQTMTEVNLTFITKYYHFNTDLLYDHSNRCGTWTYSWRNPSDRAIGRCISRNQTVHYNGVSLANQEIDIQKMKIFDTFENPLVGVSPIQPPPLDKEAGLYQIGVDADYFDTGTKDIGWWGLNGFYLQTFVYANLSTEFEGDNETDELWPIGFNMFETSAGGVATGRMTTDLVRFAEDPWAEGEGGGEIPPPPPGGPWCWPWCGGGLPSQ